MTAADTRHGPLHRALRIVRARPRLALSILFGLAAFAVLPGAWRVATRGLVAWDVGTALYLALAFR